MSPAAQRAGLRALGPGLRDVAGALRRASLGSWLVAGGGVALAAAFAWRALGDPALPGGTAEPLGWWGWWDQSQTLRSARALAAFDLSPAQHWYPLGYSVLLALAGVLGRDDGALLVGLVCLLATYGSFVAVARRTGVPQAVAVPLFLASLLGNPAVFREWVVPWNTTPVATLVWLSLLLLARRIEGRGRPWQLGVAAGLIPLFRPTEAYATAILLAAALLADRRAGRPVLRGALGLLGGLAAVGLPYALLHLAIYGPRPSDYMRHSGQVGFTAYDLGWKLYVLLADPRAWFGGVLVNGARTFGGESLLQGCPWAALGFAGLLPALRRGGVPATLAALVAANTLLYVSYTDMLPTGLWTFLNLHYWIWALPGDALLAAWLVMELARRGAGRCLAWASLAGVVALLCIRLDPRPVAERTPAKAVDYRGPSPGLFQSYFGEWHFRDQRGELDNMDQVRVVPTLDGVRVIALRRPIAGRLEWLDRPPALVQSGRWGLRFGVGLPRW